MNKTMKIMWWLCHFKDRQQVTYRKKNYDVIASWSRQDAPNHFHLIKVNNDFIFVEEKTGKVSHKIPLMIFENIVAICNGNCSIEQALEKDRQIALKLFDKQV